ncbi:MAG: hypothetical protein COA79_03000 [Planctomycetota bacterium]|nr:MAG: hypothetical protein COA79_03000 [Planctomycetota bacterium]
MSKNPCNIYYFNFIDDNKHTSTRSHQHPFWQLEILLEGEFSFNYGKKTVLVKGPSIILIPPNTIHKFQYDLKLTKILSIKFQINSSDTNFHTIIKNIIHPINYIVDAFEYEIIHNTLKNKILLENLTNTLWTHFYSHLNQEMKNNLNNNIKNFVETKTGKKLNIHDIAEHFNLSTSYISSYFKKINAISLKEFIDERRVYYAKTLLLFSEFNISEIAIELEFKDLYSFSHFFKRKTNLTPTAFKKIGKI